MKENYLIRKNFLKVIFRQQKTSTEHFSITKDLYRIFSITKNVYNEFIDNKRFKRKLFDEKNFSEIDF